MADFLFVTPDSVKTLFYRCVTCCHSVRLKLEVDFVLLYSGTHWMMGGANQEGKILRAETLQAGH